MIFSFLRFITLLNLVLATSTFVCASLNNVTDRQALLAVKVSIKDDPFGVLNSWNDSSHFCYWTGVTCSHKRPRVTELNLASQHLVGTLSSHIGNLSFLRSIYLYQNGFHGSIPNEIGRLFRLQRLVIGNNSFEGGFPANLSHCTNIRRISMSLNQLGGKLPEFTSWRKLYNFNVEDNQFIGSIPPSIGNISSLHYFVLSYNNLVGHVPLEIAHLANLELLALERNNLQGTFPSSVYNFSSLYEFAIDRNEFEGELQPDLGFTLPKLQKFYVGSNKFSGSLPPSISNASNLVELEMSYNNFRGPVPKNLGSLSRLHLLNLGSNLLGEDQLPDGLSFINSLINCTHLEELDLNENGFGGELPKSIVNLSTTMYYLDLFENHIHGSIPLEIGKLVSLTQLDLRHNFLTGTIPDSVGQLSKLGALQLGRNNISGLIPTSMSNISQLVILGLNNNLLQGSIPTELFNITTLETVSLAHNSLGGVIPVQVVGLSQQCVFLYLAQNLFRGPLPSNIGSFKQLVELDVSNNRLTGNIPASLGGCVMLEQLYMEGNFFEGRIPLSFKALKSLLVLDMSCNNMSEEIPRFFVGLHLIQFLNLSHNKLGGEVPTEGLFSNFSLFSVAGNLQLCGGIEELQLPSCPVNEKNKFSLRMILLLVLLPLAFSLLCLAFIFYRRRKSKQMRIPVSIMQDSQYPRLSYQDLLIATNEFSPNNLLGEGRYGSVFKGVIESQQQAVAVKVLNVQIHGANKTFLAECETLRSIRHRNLIKIITACSSTDFKGNAFKALVFEFMTNGSLDNWLHPSPSSEQGSERNLNLLQRLNISIDVALGVDYLHHHSHRSIVHCDIKPSNILLDEEFVAHVGDFGLAKFSFDTTSDINRSQTSSTGVRGTIGYVPPEYGMGSETSAEGDVYSYGILLLEMFSGKRPTDSSILMPHGDNNLHEYVKNAVPHRVMDIVDPRIILNQEDSGLTANQSYSRTTMEICMITIFEVGILCSKEIPTERIDMGVAIKRLNGARDKLLQPQ
ncbi:putative receptor-like protein kinase At3g47110 isoform X2 [Apium graveolens]|uniref:putative receptor-like protein kinase At3g47110 isoform X2 n=1 Tax=Apium graveolens TaxID=4045 RepID=UPI003D7A7868